MTLEERFDANLTGICTEDFISEVYFKEDILDFCRKEIEDRLDEVMDINFYDWNKETQQMISNKILDKINHIKKEL